MIYFREGLLNESVKGDFEFRRFLDKWGRGNYKDFVVEEWIGSIVIDPRKQYPKVSSEYLNGFFSDYQNKEYDFNCKDFKGRLRITDITKLIPKKSDFFDYEDYHKVFLEFEVGSFYDIKYL